MEKHLVWHYAAIVMLMAATGLASCGNDEPEEPIVRPNVPHIFYQVKGTVTDPTGAPLQGIAVCLKDNYGRFYMRLDSVTTDNQGAYATQVVEDANIHDGLVVIAQDVDGEEGGGTFLTDTLDMTQLPRRKVGEGDDQWDSGQWEVTADFVLKRQ